MHVKIHTCIQFQRYKRQFFSNNGRTFIPWNFLPMSEKNKDESIVWYLDNPETDLFKAFLSDNSYLKHIRNVLFDSIIIPL